MKRPIHVSIARYVAALVLLGARWFLSKVGGTADSMPAEPPRHITTPPATSRPLCPMGGGHYAEWCECGCPPAGETIVVQMNSGRLIAMHPECLHGRG